MTAVCLPPTLIMFYCFVVSSIERLFFFDLQVKRRKGQGEVLAEKTKPGAKGKEAETDDGERTSCARTSVFNFLLRFALLGSCCFVGQEGGEGDSRQAYEPLSPLHSRQHSSTAQFSVVVVVVSSTFGIAGDPPPYVLCMAHTNEARPPSPRLSHRFSNALQPLLSLYI